MDFGIIYQLKVKKFWWLDTFLYFVMTLLLAALILFLIFTVKISLQERKLQELEKQISETGTSQQKELEKKVFEYQQKIDNLAILLVNHKLPSNVFKVLEQSTLPNVWFHSFTLGAKEASVNLSGETENMTSLSRQVNIFEENNLIKNIMVLGVELAENGRIKFILSLSFDPQIFFSLSAPVETELPSEGLLETTSPSTSSFLNL